MLQEAGEHLARLQETMGKRLGDPDDPLLVSVRSGAKFSMPGMMDTVLNLRAERRAPSKGLAKQTEGDVRFARDAYRRFIQMFGKIVMDVPADAFERALDEAKEAKFEGAQDTDLDADDLAALIERFKAIYREHTNEEFPQDPKDQLRLVDRRRLPSRGTASAPATTAGRTRSATTWGRRSTSSRWCSATAATTPARASRSPAIRRPARRCPTATTCPTRRARTSSPASATRCSSRSSRSSTRPRTDG